MTTIATLFSGFDLVGVGARAVGLSHLWGVEWDDAIANVARANGFHTITADILDVDPHTLPFPDVLHASPVCTRASIANQSAEVNEDGLKESLLDIAMGEKVAQFIDVMTPRAVTVENVYPYRNFKAFKAICAALDRNGYWWDYDNINCADYGVPQTRRRLFLRARRGALLPMLSQPERWVGWYEAIEDLIPGLPESRFASWQLARLPEEIRGNLMSVINGEASDYILAGEPVQTVASNHGSNKYRAFILDCQKAGDANGQRGVTLPQSDSPVFTVTGGKGQQQPIRAYLVSGGNTQLDKITSMARTATDPAPTVFTDLKNNGRAFIVDSLNYHKDGTRNPTTRNELEPIWSIPVHSVKHPEPRAWLSQGRVVKMTPRALARFQSIPDDYILPDNKKLACRGIGNGFPSLAYQKLIGPMVEGL